jgi:hypothetical protein
LDEHRVPFSSTLRGSLRLRIIDIILQLRVGDHVTVVFHRIHGRVSWLSHRAGLFNLFKSTVRESLPRSISIGDKDNYVEHDISLRSIERGNYKMDLTIHLYQGLDRQSPYLCATTSLQYIDACILLLCATSHPPSTKISPPLSASLIRTTWNNQWEQLIAIEINSE